jgi:hypothetical protein
MDYVHIYSVVVDSKDDNLPVSMRSQYAVFKLIEKMVKPMDFGWIGMSLKDWMNF